MCFYRPTFSHTLLSDADRGDADAQFELGRVYFEGRDDSSTSASFTPGVERNHATASAWLKKAAAQGHTEARQLLEVVRLHFPKGVQ